MSALIPRRAVTRLPIDVAAHIMAPSAPEIRLSQTLGAIILRRHPLLCAPTLAAAWGHPSNTVPQLASERELNDFLKSVEKRAFKRALYNVRNEESALDIVQDSMMKLSIHYGDRDESELQPLFQRILSNSILDWFRRQKTHTAVISNFSDFEGDTSEDGDFDVLEALISSDSTGAQQSAESTLARSQMFATIENEIRELPQRQREAFLMRYWEDMDVAETAEAMGCTSGSVKTHCFRAIQTLAKALSAKGIKI